MRDKSASKKTWSIYMPVAFAVTLTLLGLWVSISPSTLSPVTAAYQEACARNPNLFGWSNHVAPLLPAFLAAIVISSLLPAFWTLLRQIKLAKHVAAVVRNNACPLPRKLIQAAAPLGVLDRVVCVTDNRLYAFCHGIREPQICVSTGLVRKLSTEELTAVLLHESCHLLNHDPLKLLATRVIAGALQMLPVASELRERYQLSRELEADDVAIEGTSIIALASALLKVFTSDKQWDELSDAPIGALSITTERISRLAGHEDNTMPPLSKVSIISSLLVAMALFVSTFGFVEANEYSAAKARECCPTMTGYKTAMSMSENEMSMSKCNHVGRFESRSLTT